MKKNLYIAYRRVKGSLRSLCFLLCRIFPTDHKLVSVCSFEGRGGFGCNPKYVVEALHKADDSLRFVWLLNKDSFDREFPDYIRKVPNTPWSASYWLTRSKIWIDNYRKPLGTLKRKGQYYLNTNHYTVGIKTTGLLRGDGFSKMAYMVSRADSDMIDDLIIDSEWCEECFDKALVYDGRMLKTGSPRCDVLYGDRTEWKRKFREEHDIPYDARVVMYAPTFREGDKAGKRYVYSEPWTIDFKRVLDNLSRKFGGTWYLCLRAHPQIADTYKDYENIEIEDRIIDVSGADDMYEILAGMDAYVTDYSSAIFEAGYARIPAFIYADDIEEYERSRGALYWDMSSADRHCVRNNKETHPNMDLTLPFTVAGNNDELEEDILNFDMSKYNDRLSKFHDAIGLIFDGRTSERVAERIIKS